MPRAHELFDVHVLRPDGDVQGTSSRPLDPSVRPADHPGMARMSNSMHDDGYASDVSWLEGPTGDDPEVLYFRYKDSFGGMCPGFGFDERGWLYTISFSKERALLLQLDPGSLEVRNAHALPARRVDVWDAIRETPFRPFRALDKIFRDTSGGAYFFVDRWNRVVVPSLDDTIKVLTPAPHAGGGFSEGTPLVLLDDPIHAGDNLVSVMPDWDERDGRPVYWYTTQRGAVGLVDGETGLVLDHYLLWTDPDARGRSERPERIQNAFAVSAKGAFVVSSYALYRFRRSGDSIERVWRAEYCRLDRCGSGCPDNDDPPACANPKAKPGQIDFGSGTTPTLLGDEHVVIGDGQRRMNLCVYRQDDGELVGRMPMFDSRASACENSVVGFGRSVVVGNTYGYTSPFRPAVATRPGLTRVDVKDDAAGPPLDVCWNDDGTKVMSAPPALSAGSGLLYLYTAEPHGLVRRRWSLLGMCFRTGRELYRVPIQTERKRARLSRYDNAWGTMTIGPERSLYLCMWKGFLRLRDRP